MKTYTFKAELPYYCFKSIEEIGCEPRLRTLQLRHIRLGRKSIRAVTYTENDILTSHYIEGQDSLIIFRLPDNPTEWKYVAFTAGHAEISNV